MFYDLFCDLCKKKGVSPTRATIEIGLSRTIGTKWKNTGATPQGDTLQKIAAYFGVTTDYLLGNEQTEKPATESSGLNINIQEMIKAIEERSKRTVTIMGFDGNGQEHFELTPEQYEAFKTLFGNDKKE